MRITQPHPNIIDEGNRRKARFLSFCLFSALIIFPILQITSEVIHELPFYSGSTFILAGLYLLSKTNHVKLTSTLTVLLAAILPFLTISFHTNWEGPSLAFQLLTWPVIAVLIASQLFSKEKVGFLVFVMSGGLTILTWLHPEISIADSIELIAASFAIQTLLWLTGWINEYYRHRLQVTKRSIETRQRELEIYTDLLQHDLGNDVQMILGSLELAQLTLEEREKCISFIESSLAAAERMKSLIQIFSIEEDLPEANIVTILYDISERAQIVFKTMKVNINVDPSILDNPPKYGKLINLVFENLLRNTAQHAGDTPTVSIELSTRGDKLRILFTDDGLGIPEEIRSCIFGKGVSTGPKGRGQGLYLAKRIIESEKGTIHLIQSTKKGCCFEITLPIQM